MVLLCILMGFPTFRNNRLICAFMILDQYTGLKMGYNATKALFLFLKIISFDTCSMKDGTKMKYKLPYNINP